MSGITNLTEGQQALERREPTLMDVIREVASRPGLEHVEALERLLAMKERAEDREAKRLFMEALAQAQAELPQIERLGSGQSNPYGRLEDIDSILRPIMARHGFALSFDEKTSANDSREHTATLTHRAGHSEVKSCTLPVDKGGNKNGVQAVGSTTSYAQRYLTGKHFNLVFKGADTDGEDLTPITDEQMKDLQTLMSDVKADTAKFLAFLGIDKLSSLPQRDLGRAIAALEQKRKGK